MNAAQLKTAQALPWYASKWWMRTRAVPATITSAGVSASAELYCPWWARPLDMLHVALFGSTKLQPI